MPEARFLKIIIIALLLLNAGILGYLWIGRGMHHPPPPPPGMEHPGGNAGEYLRSNLQLTAAQETRYRGMREQHHQRVMDIHERMRDQKRELYALMQQADTTQTAAAATKLIDSLAAGQHEIERITYDHFRELRALCTAEQQKKFDEIIGEALERMR